MITISCFGQKLREKMTVERPKLRRTEKCWSVFSNKDGLKQGKVLELNQKMKNSFIST